MLSNHVKYYCVIKMKSDKFGVHENRWQKPSSELKLKLILGSLCTKQLGGFNILGKWGKSVLSKRKHEKTKVPIYVNNTGCFLW